MAKKMKAKKKVDDVDLPIGTLGNGGSISYTVTKGKMGRLKIESGAPFKPNRYKLAGINVAFVLQVFSKRDRAKVLRLAKKVLVAMEGS